MAKEKQSVNREKTKRFSNKSELLRFGKSARYKVNLHKSTASLLTHESY